MALSFRGPGVRTLDVPYIEDIPVSSLGETSVVLSIIAVCKQGLWG